MHTVIWLKVVLSNTNHFQTNLKATTITGQNEPKNNGNKGVTPYFFRTGAPLKDEV